MTTMYLATVIYPERVDHANKVDTLIEGGWYAIDQFPFSCKFVKVLDGVNQKVTQGYPSDACVLVSSFTTGNHVRLQLVPHKMAEDFEERMQYWEKWGRKK